MIDDRLSMSDRTHAARKFVDSEECCQDAGFGHRLKIQYLAEAEKAEAEKAAAEKAAADKAKDQDQGCFRSVDSVPEGVRHVGTIGIQLGVRGATPLMNFRGEWGLGGRRGLPQQGMQEGVWGRRAHPVKYLMSILVRLGICLGLIGFA